MAIELLHLLTQSALSPAVLQRIGLNDGIVLMENAVWNALQNSAGQNTLSLLQSNKIYVLAPELASRGIQAQELAKDIAIIDYPELVQLCTQFRGVQSWM